jgi:hypothetical protein
MGEPYDLHCSVARSRRLPIASLTGAPCRAAAALPAKGSLPRLFSPPSHLRLHRYLQTHNRSLNPARRPRGRPAVKEPSNAGQRPQSIRQIEVLPVPFGPVINRLPPCGASDRHSPRASTLPSGVATVVLSIRITWAPDSSPLIPGVWPAPCAEERARVALAAPSSRTLTSS